MTRLIPVLVLALGCKNKAPEPNPTLDITPFGEPEVSACQGAVELELRAVVGAEHTGRFAAFIADEEVLWEGVLTPEGPRVLYVDEIEGEVFGGHLLSGRTFAPHLD